MKQAAVERYRHAVAEKSRAEEMFRTAVQYMDSYYWRYKVEYWTKEVQEALEALYI
jgi:hypothetical protein